MIYVANFGTGKASLATVGYTLLNSDNTTKVARTTTGVTEIGTATGVYACDISFPSLWSGIVLFDTGEASPRYVSIDYTFQPNLDIVLSSIPELAADAVWDELLVDHNTVETFGRRLNTWPLTPIRDSIVEIIKLMRDLNKLVKDKFKKFEKFLKDNKEDINKDLEVQGTNIEILDNKVNGKLEKLKEDFSSIDKSISNFSEKLKLLIGLRDILNKSKERMTTIESSLLDISRDKIERKDLTNIISTLKNEESKTYKKFTDIFDLIKNGIEGLEKELSLVAKISSKTIDAENLEEILTEEGILNGRRA